MCCCAMCTKLGGDVAESLVTIYIDKCVLVWYNDDNEGRRDSATERYNLKQTILKEISYMNPVVLNAIEVIYKAKADAESWYNSNITTRNTLNVIKGFKSAMNAVCSLMATVTGETRPAVVATCAYVTECRRIVTTRMASDHEKVYECIIEMCDNAVNFLKMMFDQKVDLFDEDEINPFTNPEMYLDDFWDDDDDEDDGIIDEDGNPTNVDDYINSNFNKE